MTEERAERLAAFSAGALDFDAVRALWERHAITRLGLRLARELAPVGPELARARYRRLEEARRLEELGRGYGLGGVGDPRAALEAAAAGRRVLTGEELAGLAGCLRGLESLGAALCERVEMAPALGELGRRMPALGDLADALDRIVDPRGRARDEASPRLATLRRGIARLERSVESELSKVARRASARSLLSDPNPFRRAGRLVLAVKSQSAGRVPGIVHDRSQSEATVFVEPREVVEMQNRLAGERIDERSEVARVLLEATRAVRGRAADLARAGELAAEAELALVSLRIGQELGARAPRIAGEDGEPEGLFLREARHPLLVVQERSGQIERAVPIDVRLGEGFDLLVITGPNTGGKTLALKTVGLAVLLARCGLPIVCAPGSRVPLWDGICADIGDEQEVSQNLSTFASHLERIRRGLARAGPRTLVLLDELGGGTDPDEGAALGDAILSWLHERRVPAMATTHLGRLKEFAYRHPRAENACVEFDAVSLEPRYRLIVGTPGESSALAIARRMGVPAEVVDQAELRIARREGEVAELMAEMRGAREHVVRTQSELDRRLDELEDRRSELAGRAEELRRRGERLEAEGRLDLEARVREARDELEGIGRLAQQLPGPARAEMERRLRRLDSALSGAAWSERRAAWLAGLRKGQLVWVPRLGRRCVISRVDARREQVTVKVGRIPTVVAFDELSSDER